MALPPRQAPSRSPNGPPKLPVVALAVAAGVLAAFAIGVLVGRSRTPEPMPIVDIPAEAAPTTPPTTTGPEIEMIRPDGSTAPPSALGGATQGLAPIAASNAAPEVPPTQAPTPEALAAPAPAGVPAAAARPAAAPKPAPRPVAANPPAVKPGGGPFTVQVAAFRDRESAERLSLQLESRGYDAYVQRSEVAGKGTWYRVRVGAFEDKEAARALASKIERQEGRSAYITTR